MRFFSTMMACAAALWAADAGAQGAALAIDPATVAIPDLSGGRDPDTVRNGWKYFYFWRADTSFEEAFADISECYLFLPVRYAHPGTPMFAPWEERPSAEIVRPSYQPYGLVGAAIGAIVAGPLERRARQSRLRRCMEPRGYQRYPLQERRWEQLTDNFSPASIAMQAKAASGPAPDGLPLPEDR